MGTKSLYTMINSSLIAAGTMIGLSQPVLADQNPLFSNKVSAVSLNEQNLNKVKGSGYNANYYGFLGQYYLGQSLLYSSYAKYYGGLGSSSNNSTEGSYYSSASSSAYNAYYYFSYASSYAKNGS